MYSLLNGSLSFFKSTVVFYLGTAVFYYLKGFIFYGFSYYDKYVNVIFETCVYATITLLVYLLSMKLVRSLHLYAVLSWLLFAIYVGLALNSANNIALTQVINNISVFNSGIITPFGFLYLAFSTPLTIAIYSTVVLFQKPRI